MGGLSCRVLEMGSQAPARRQHALGLQHDRAVDHRPARRAAPGDAASAASTSRAQSMSASDGRQRLVDGRDLRGWMHSLAPKPRRRAHCQVGEQARAVVQLRRDAGHGCVEAGDARGDHQAAGGVGQRLVVVGDVQVEVEREVQRAEHQPRSTPGATATLAALAMPLPVSSKASTRSFGTAARNRGDLLARLGLGQHGGLRGALRSTRRSSPCQGWRRR
jgi:hypothetical protein